MYKISMLMTLNPQTGRKIGICDATPQEIVNQLRELYEMVRENDDFKGWERGQATLSRTETILGLKARPNPYI